MTNRRVFKVSTSQFETFSNQLGVSLPMVIMALGLVSAATYTIYFFSKSGRQQAAVVRKISYTELERKRISTILADSINCEANFLNKNPGGSTFNAGTIYNNLVTASPVATFATTSNTNKANEYYKLGGAGSVTSGVLKLSDIRTTWNGINSNGGNLVLTYLDSSANNDHLAFSGSKYARIVIPMYFNVVGGQIKNCYAITENTKVSDAIANACITTTPKNVVYYNKTGTILNNCLNNIEFQNAATNTTDCSGMAGTYLSGIDIIDKTSATDTGHSIQIKTDKCKGFTSTNPASVGCAPGGSAYGIAGGVIKCDYAGATKDTPQCTAGQMLVKTGSTSVTCLTVDCSTTGPQHFINAISGSAVTCTTAPTSQCAANQFVKGFDSTGTAICGNMPVMNGSCASGEYGVSVTRNAANYNGTLNCSAYVKTKSCSPSTNTNFVTSFSASGTANCTAY